MITGIELWKKIDERITSDPDSFNMNIWVNECGTSACIAGHAVLVNSEPGEIPFDTLERLAGELDLVPDYDQVGATLLGLSFWQAEGLFYHTRSEEAAAYVARKAREGETHA